MWQIKIAKTAILCSDSRNGKIMRDVFSLNLTVSTIAACNICNRLWSKWLKKYTSRILWYHAYIDQFLLIILTIRTILLK